MVGRGSVMALIEWKDHTGKINYQRICTCRYNKDGEVDVARMQEERLLDYLPKTRVLKGAI